MPLTSTGPSPGRALGAAPFPLGVAPRHLGAGRHAPGRPGRVPWLVAFVVSLAVTAAVVLPLALWAAGADPPRPRLSAPSVESGARSTP